MKLMHHKYLVADAALPSARVWTGSTNLTDDAWDLEENNILRLADPTLAQAYARDFQELWATSELGESGAQDGIQATLTYAGQPCAVRVLFSPGCGQIIDDLVAQTVARATRRIRVCSMLLNSGALIGALRDVLAEGRIPVDGVYDRTQMLGVFEQWQEVPRNHWKIGAVQQIIQGAALVGKRSTPYSPTSQHDFMHMKCLVVDDTVITGSYNFSHSAELNAENILFIESQALAASYSGYIDHVKAKYGGG
jgi:phosphatidylserine/phosphatidylglycerophosphate/cardiolipin synthase-like enzyme